MASENKPGIRVAGGYCLDCKTHFVEMEILGLPAMSKHGLTEDQAHEIFCALRDILNGTAKPAATQAERLVAAMFGLT